METKASLVAYFSAWFTAAFGALTLQDVALYVGIGMSVLTAGVNWYYNRRRTLFVEGKT